METFSHARSFRDLVVYQKSRAIAKEIFLLSQTFPKEELYSLTSQIRDASRSIGAQIAEGWAKRRYQRHFVSKLTDADGEQQETQHWLGIAFDCGYVTEDQAKRLLDKLSEIGRMLNSMIAKAESFCGDRPTTLRENASEYFVGQENPRITGED